MFGHDDRSDEQKLKDEEAPIRFNITEPALQEMMVAVTPGLSSILQQVDQNHFGQELPERFATTACLLACTEELAGLLYEESLNQLSDETRDAIDPTLIQVRAAFHAYALGDLEQRRKEYKKKS